MKNNHNLEKLLYNNWDTLIRLIGLCIICVLLGLGYLMFGNAIKNGWSKHDYTEDELNRYAQNVLKREREENLLRTEANWDKVVDGIHLRTGFYDDPNLQDVIASCTSCHSAKLVTQNKATRQGWKSMIVWMQETQGLPDLGKKEPIILDYLAKYYAPKKIGRRQNLNIEEIEWYVLNMKES